MKLTSSPRVYRVYVVELDVRRHGVPCLYVGSSGKPRGARLTDHARGGMTAGHDVRRFGVRRLRPDLLGLRGYAPTRRGAERIERQIRDELRRAGYCLHPQRGGGAASPAGSHRERRA